MGDSYQNQPTLARLNTMLKMNNPMKRLPLFAALSGCLCLMLTSCSTRSISDSGYREGYGYYGRASSSMDYRGEMSEWDVLGTGSNNGLVAKHEPVSLIKGERVLVIQSGAFFPDDQMTRDLETYCTVAMFSGVPPKEKDPNFAERLRSAALSGGYSKVLVYWGVLESGRRDQATMAVSWVPVVGMFVPDSSQTMRIRVKAIVVDATSGRWSMYVADGFEDARLSAPLVRESSDQGQVARLKALAYRNLVNKLF